MTDQERAQVAEELRRLSEQIDRLRATADDRLTRLEQHVQDGEQR